MSKRKPDGPPAPAPKTTHLTSRNPPWTYLKLQLIHQPNTSNATKSQPLDPLTARTHLTSALSQFLGLTGTAIPLDILKITTPGLDTAGDDSSSNGNASQEKIVWVRVPRADATAVVDALSSWIGGGGGGGGGSEVGDDAVGAVAWRVCARGNNLGGLTCGGGGDLFLP